MSQNRAVQGPSTQEPLPSRPRELPLTGLQETRASGACHESLCLAASSVRTVQRCCQDPGRRSRGPGGPTDPSASRCGCYTWRIAEDINLTRLTLIGCLLIGFGRPHRYHFGGLISTSSPGLLMNKSSRVFLGGGSSVPSVFWLRWGVPNSSVPHRSVFGPHRCLIVRAP